MSSLLEPGSDITFGGVTNTRPTVELLPFNAKGQVADKIALEIRESPENVWYQAAGAS